MLDQHDTHSSDNPANQEEQELTLDIIMGRLTVDECDFLENHITNLVKEAKQPFENAKRMQREINELAERLRTLEIHTWGKTRVEVNSETYRLYREQSLKQSELINLLTK